MRLVAAATYMLRTSRVVGGIAVDLVIISVDEGMLVVPRREVGVRAAHRCSGESRAATERRGRVNIAERMCLVAVVDKVVLAVETGVGAVAVVLVEASGSSRRGWRGSSNGNGSGAPVETFVEVGLSLVIRDARPRRRGILATSFAHLSSRIEVLLKLVIAGRVAAGTVEGWSRVRWR